MELLQYIFEGCYSFKIIPKKKTQKNNYCSDSKAIFLLSKLTIWPTQLN